MLDDLLAGQDARILDNPLYRLNVVVVKSHGRLAHDHKASPRPGAVLGDPRQP